MPSCAQNVAQTRLCARLRVDSSRPEEGGRRTHPPVRGICVLGNARDRFGLETSKRTQETMAVTSEEVNFLIFRYLQESGASVVQDLRAACVDRRNTWPGNRSWNAVSLLNKTAGFQSRKLTQKCPLGACALSCVLLALCRFQPLGLHVRV